MNKQIVENQSRLSWLFIALLALGSYLLATGAVTLLTPDQQGQRFFERGDFAEASNRFTDPMWRGVALFRQGEFKKSAGIFAGMDTAEAAFNHGNALVMQGQYDAAAERYARALELRPEWADATNNREIALARAAMLRQEGGEGTGGMLDADDIVFSEGKSPPGSGDEQTEGGEAISDEELRAVWLRQVQTKPADFLAAKFAYQQAMRQAPGDEQEVAQ
jgi:Ca-activated chloride channel family protein